MAPANLISRIPIAPNVATTDVARLLAAAFTDYSRLPCVTSPRARSVCRCDGNTHIWWPRHLCGRTSTTSDSSCIPRQPSNSLARCIRWGTWKQLNHLWHALLGRPPWGALTLLGGVDLHQRADPRSTGEARGLYVWNALTGSFSHKNGSAAGCHLRR